MSAADTRPIDCFRGEVEFEPPSGSFRKSMTVKGLGMFFCGLPTEAGQATRHVWAFRRR